MNHHISGLNSWRNQGCWKEEKYICPSWTINNHLRIFFFFFWLKKKEPRKVENIHTTVSFMKFFWATKEVCYSFDSWVSKSLLSPSRVNEMNTHSWWWNHTQADMSVAIAFQDHPRMECTKTSQNSLDAYVWVRVFVYMCIWVCLCTQQDQILQNRLCFFPSLLLPFGSVEGISILSFQDFTSSQSWSVESSTSESPTSIAIINEISESLLTAGSCSPERWKHNWN